MVKLSTDIVLKKLSEIKPYDKNPRLNDGSVEYVANSISKFGFEQPIVIDKDGVIVCGHTRYKASKKLKLKEVPCVVADHLTEEQIKAYRLADNKVGEKSLWDDDFLMEEIEAIDIDMTIFGFDDIPDVLEEEEEEEKENERLRTDNAYNLREFDETRADGYYQIPMLERVDYIPEDLIGFNYLLNTQPKENTGIHFYIDDYQFERIWASPYQYTDKLREWDCVLTPDFSLYMDMPIAMKIWNIYRSRLIGQILQDYGSIVIPTVSWAEEATFDFCFDGIPTNSTISVSTIGVKKDKEATKIWFDGMDQAMERLKPKNILVYGGDIGYDFQGANVKYYTNKVTERMKDI